MVKQRIPTQIGIGRTRWGWVPYAHDGARLRGLLFPRDTKAAAEADARAAWPEAGDRPQSLPGLEEELAAYFGGKQTAFGVTVDLDGVGEFHRRVYEECRRIPYGTVVSYGELAAMAGSPKAARAVGQAMAKNPIPIVIPCHRVLGSDGSLHGFGGGLGLKSRLLSLEGATHY